MDSIAMLEHQTYVVEHSPNCSSQYLLRLVAPGTGSLDKLPPGKTNDVIGYGRTLEEAATVAFERLEVLKKSMREGFPLVQPG